MFYTGLENFVNRVIKCTKICKCIEKIKFCIANY